MRGPPFLAWAKKPGGKKTTPAFAPVAVHRGRGAGGICRGGILPPRKTPQIHVRRPAGLVRRLRRYGGAPEIKINGNGNGNSRFTAASPSRHRPAARGRHRSALTTTRGSKMRLGFKIVMVLGLPLAILVPLTMIGGVIHSSEARRVGKECVSTCRCRGSRDQLKT